MKQIAVIFEDDIFNRKGSFVAKLERVKHLEGFRVDVFCIQTSYGPIERLLLPKRSLDGVSERRLGHPSTLEFGGVTFNMLWKPYSILDHFLFFKLRLRPLRYPRFLKRCAGLLKGYDLVSAHSFEGGRAALEAKKLYGVPFTVTWHGSDIHTKPFKYHCIFGQTGTLLREAGANLFVSRALLLQSDTIGPGNKLVLYNGCDSAFLRLPDNERLRLREEFGVLGTRVICFAGALVPIKNVNLLPDIFEAIQRRYSGPLSFWIIGDGPQRAAVEASAGVDIRFLGDVPHELMPQYFNCVDMFVLPSKNEGCPLVLLEALRCGAGAIGSRVGGIPEVVGMDNTVPLGPGFVEAMAARAVELLESPAAQSASPDMDWSVTADREAAAYNAIIG